MGEPTDLRSVSGIVRDALTLRERGRRKDKPGLESGAGQAARQAAAELKHCQLARRATRPAAGAVFPETSLTRHRTFRDGYLR